MDKLPIAMLSRGSFVAALLMAGLTGPNAVAQTGSGAQERAIAAIKDLGGKVELDKTASVEVDLNATQVGAADLVHLEVLKDLRILSLGGTRVSDAGLAHLEGLAGLQFLFAN